ncbi:fasciclin-like arabinogalactan protein 11 [Arachis stenosperma]|uniref:fasciclin-like arabinogalactan protein 11 n=1 Tax=Arachis stenosperma TaxID=217475 RepID=UPI0025AD2EE3|nr:fasciclin-like arabinogalactan protein 11 [Arachis stenosperma]
MKQVQLSYSLLLLMFATFYSCTNSATAPSPKASSPTSSKPLVPTLPDPPDSSDSAPDDIGRILKKAKTFRVLTRLLKSTEIMSNINSQLMTAKSGGLTIFAPDDNAFAQLKAGFLNSLNQGQKIELLQFHILPQYVSSTNFDSLSNPVQTVAGEDPTKLPFNVMASGNSVNISTGVVNATINGLVYSDTNLAIYRVNQVLLPLDFFVKAKAPAPAPVEAESPIADKKSSTEDQENQDKSAALSLLSIQGTALMYIAVGFVVVAMI